MVFFGDKDGDGVLVTEQDVANGDHTSEELEVIQRLWYYPFGMHLQGIGQLEAEPSQQYRYNGKEFEESVGLYAYGFRYYDPAIGRFTGVDPIADRFAHVSVYNYAENEPIAHIDLWGLQKARPNITFSASGAVTSGELGVEVLTLGARAGETLQFDKQDHVSISATYDSANKDLAVESSVYEYSETTFGISGGDILGGSLSITKNSETGETTNSTEVSLGLFYYKNETTTDSEGNKENYQVVGIAFGGSAGMGIIGVEGSVNLEVNMTPTVPSGWEDTELLPSTEAPIDNTRQEVYLVPIPNDLFPIKK